MGQKTIRLLFLISVTATIVVATMTVAAYVRAPTETKLTGPSCSICTDLGTPYQSKDLSGFKPLATVTGLLVVLDSVLAVVVFKTRSKAPGTRKPE